MVSTFVSRISAGHIVSCLLSENRSSLVIDSGWLIVGFFGSGHDLPCVIAFFCSKPYSDMAMAISYNWLFQWDYTCYKCRYKYL